MTVEKDQVWRIHSPQLGRAVDYIVLHVDEDEQRVYLESDVGRSTMTESALLAFGQLVDDRDAA